MELEDQAVDKDWLEYSIAEKAEEIVKDLPRTLWD